MQNIIQSVNSVKRCTGKLYSYPVFNLCWQHSNVSDPEEKTSLKTDAITSDSTVEVGEEANECKLISKDDDSANVQSMSIPNKNNQEKNTTGETLGVKHVLEETLTEPPVPPIRTKKLAREQAEGNNRVRKKTLLESFNIPEWVRKFSKYLESFTCTTNILTLVQDFFLYKYKKVTSHNELLYNYVLRLCLKHIFYNHIRYEQTELSDYMISYYRSGTARLKIH